MKKNKQLEVIGKKLSKLSFEAQEINNYYDHNRKKLNLKVRDSLVRKIMKIRKKRAFLFSLYKAIDNSNE